MTKSNEMILRTIPKPMLLWKKWPLLRTVRGSGRLLGVLSKWLITSGDTYQAVDDYRLRIDAGDVYQAAMLLGTYDPEVTAVIEQYASPGSVVLDVGANLGYFTLRAGRSVGGGGQVHAFECDPRVVRRLTDHAELNNLPQIRVVEAAVTDRHNSTVSLNLPSQLGWATTEGNLARGSEQVEVETVTLDGYVAATAIRPSEISFVKIDVEGAELSALRGFQETLSQMSAPVLVEIFTDAVQRTGHTFEEIYQLMATADYRPFRSMLVHGKTSVVQMSRAPYGDVLFLKV